MIKINLLPEHERVPESAPKGPIVIRMSGVVVLGLVVLLDVFLYLGNVLLSSETASVQLQIDPLKKDVAEHTQLKSVQSQYEQRKKDIVSVATRPIVWTEAIDQIWEVIHRNPRVWIEGMQGLDVKAMATQLRQAGIDPKEIAKYSAGIGMLCNAATEDTGVIMKFRMDLKTREQIQKIFNEGTDHYPEWTLKELDDYEERVSNSFKVILLNKSATAGSSAGSPASSGAPPPKPAN